MGNAAAVAAAFGGGLPPGISGTNERCTVLVSNLNPDVAVIAPNIPAMHEAHFGVPMAGAVVNCVNIRLNASTISFLLEHSSAAAVMVDQEFFTFAEEALKMLERKGNFKAPLLIVIGDTNCDPKSLNFS